MRGVHAGATSGAMLFGSSPAATAADGRAFRVGVLLVALAVLSLFDLALTQAQVGRGNFAEANVLAWPGLANGLPGMLLHKGLLFGVGVAILYRLRRHWQSEAALWLLLLCHLALVGWWLSYLEHVECCLADPAVVSVAVRF
mgnify:CR=1 FL=1